MALATRASSDTRTPERAAGPIKRVVRRPADRRTSSNVLLRERIVGTTLVGKELFGRTRGPYRDSLTQPILPRPYSRGTGPPQTGRCLKPDQVSSHVVRLPNRGNGNEPVFVVSSLLA
jgi:hypothetical protein